MRRSLLYFICPIGGNGVWQWNVEQLKKRIHLFNGRKIVAVAQNGAPIHRPRMRSSFMGLDAINTVRAALPGDCEIFEVTNNPDIGEVVAWRRLWEKVLPGCEPEDAVFYGHAKGVKRGFEHPTAMKWASALYETNLDHWPLVERGLSMYPIVGSFKKLGNCFPNTLSTFHYSGTFFWARAKDFAARDWVAVPQMWAGTEAITGVMFNPAEAGCIFHEAHGSQMELYSPQYWQFVVEPSLAMWRTDHPSEMPVVDVRVVEASKGTDALHPVLVTPGFAPKRLLKAMIEHVSKTIPARTEWWLADNHYPLNTYADIEELKELCAAKGIKWHDVPNEPGCVQALNKWLQDVGTNWDDSTVVVVPDSDAAPTEPGWLEAMMLAMSDQQSMAVCGLHIPPVDTWKDRSLDVQTRGGVVRVINGVEMWHTAGFRWTFLKSIGGFMQGGKYYGSVEKLMSKAWMERMMCLGYLMEYKDEFGTRTYPAELFDQQYIDYKHAHVFSGENRSFSEYVRGKT